MGKNQASPIKELKKLVSCISITLLKAASDAPQNPKAVDASLWDDQISWDLQICCSKQPQSEAEDAKASGRLSPVCVRSVRRVAGPVPPRRGRMLFSLPYCEWESGKKPARSCNGISS